MERRDNKFRIIRTGEHEYEVWQRSSWLWVFHRWVRIGTAYSEEKAHRIACAEVANPGVTCLIEHIDNYS